MYTMAERVTTRLSAQEDLKMPISRDVVWNVDQGGEFETQLAGLVGWRMAKAVARRFAEKGRPGTERR
jgi:hypothetical protein